MHTVSVSDLEAAIAQLSRNDALIGKACESLDLQPWNLRPDGFIGLVRIICFQQISTKAGMAIWNRVREHCEALTPQTLLAGDDQGLRACGLSRPKVSHIRHVAQACEDGTLDFERIARLDDEAARAELLAVKGIGPWSVDIYLMFSLGRLDVFPAGDLALREAYRRLSGAAERLSAADLLSQAEIWRPYRSVAAHILWAASGLNRKTQNPAW